MYQLLARYYDLIHELLQDDIDFILQLAAQYGGPILELGCGTGRVLIPLAKAGYEVIGVDNEKAMLDQAQKRLAEETIEVRRRTQLMRSDLRFLVLPEAYRPSLILFTFNTALHFQEKELQQILIGIKPAMSKESCLFIDYANPFGIENAGFEEGPVVENSFRDPSTGDRVIQKSQSDLDHAKQCLHTTWIFETKDSGGKRSQHFTVDIDYWYLFPHQLQLLLERTGFRIDQMMGNYDHSPFSEDSQRLLLLARPDD